MALPTIHPEKISRAIQLPVAWLACLVVLVVVLVEGGLRADDAWMKVALVAAAVAAMIVFPCAAFLMQTKWRTHIQEDPYFSDYLGRQFKDFQPENVRQQPNAEMGPSQHEQSWEGIEQERVATYQRNSGLFLVHDWRPSVERGQVADIAIRLLQHGDGALSQGEVKSVEYHLGPKFFDYPVIETDPRDDYRLDVSAYGPMLCLARVHFHDASEPLLLKRYVDFDTSLPARPE